MKRNLSKILIPVFITLTLYIFALCESYRNITMKPEKVMDAIGVEPGMIIGEVGAGKGYFTFHLSNRVGSEGKIYANDILEKKLRYIENRMKREKVDNIETVLGRETDPVFPEKELDMVFMCYVYHELTKPVEFMINVKKYLKKDATVVILDGDPDRESTGDYSHYITKREVLENMEKSDYKLVKIEDFLSLENIYVFRSK
ncbi:class I SAM-dependent methyltransferase [candidate division KSB1 bacterium]